MRSQVLLALCALAWAVLAPHAIAQSETNPPAQVQPLDRPARQRPGEYPEYLFHEPHPAPTIDTSEGFREKYLFGDWLGARSQLAAEGIKPLVLFITVPFVNASGGLRRGFSEYDLLALDLLLDTEKLLGWHGGEFRVGFANNSGTSLSQNYVGNTFPVQLADVADPNPPANLPRVYAVAVRRQAERSPRPPDYQQRLRRRICQLCVLQGVHVGRL
jgi:hypothetical protein